MARRRSSIPFVPILLLGALLALSSGVLLYFFYTKEVPSPGGVYHEGIAGSPMHLNPLLASFNETDQDITSLLYSGLTRVDQQGRVAPDLASEWESSADATTYTFKLRENALWHDRRPVRVEDILFSIKLIQSPDFQGNPELAALWQQVRAEKIDDQTVRLVVDQPFAPLLTYTSLGILPQHLYDGIAPEDMTDALKAPSPVGSGPFRIKEANLAQVVMEANPDAYLGRPFLDEIRFSFMRDDQALAAALNALEVEGGLLRPSVGRETIERVRQNEALTLYTAPRASYTVLFINTNNPIFQPKAMRQALAYSLDRQLLVNQTVSGLGLVANSPLPFNSWAHQADADWYPYDPVKAAELFDQEGWRTNASGLRMKDGQPLKFTLYTNDDLLRVATGEELARQLKAVGLQPDFAYSGPSGLLQNFLLPRRYETIIYGIDPGVDPDPYPLWHSSQAGGEGLNVSTIDNPKMDDLLQRGRSTTDMDEREALYDQFQTLFKEEVPSIPLYHPLYTYAVDQSVRGIGLAGLFAPSSRFYNVREWYKETQRVWGR